MRSRGTFLPRSTFSRNGITSDSFSGPPNDRTRTESYAVSGTGALRSLTDWLRHNMTAQFQVACAGDEKQQDRACEVEAPNADHLRDRPGDCQTGYLRSHHDRHHAA